MSLDTFLYTYVDTKAPKTLFLLHGTGGTEQDFLFLQNELHGLYNLVGLRGNVQEHGMNRFFKRMAMGVFDEESIKEEAAKLQEFVLSWQKQYGLSDQDCVALGFSNGANMILAAIFLHAKPRLFSRAVVMHPMMPFAITMNISLVKDLKILVTHSENDSMVNTHQQDEVNEALVSNGATLDVKSYQTGHQVSGAEITDVITWLKNA